MSMKRFSYCPNAMVPEIPSVQDVLFALGLSPQEENYSFCQANHEPYINNVQLVVDKVGIKVKSVWPDEAQARKIIAKAIVRLCPEEARCLFNMAFIEAKIVAGKDWREVLSWSREVLLQTCAHCIART